MTGCNYGNYGYGYGCGYGYKHSTVANRELTARRLEGVAITKTVISHSKAGHWRTWEEIAKVSRLAGRHGRLVSVALR